MGLLSRLIGERRPQVQPVHVTDGTFASEVLRSDVPVVLDVWGPGCVPCRRLEPVIVELATRYQGKVKVAELNAAESPRAAAKLGVRGTPTIVFFRERREVERVVGFVGERYLGEIVDSELLGARPS